MNARLEEVARRDVPIGRLTTYRLGGPARFFAEADDPARLEEILDAWRGTDLPLLVLGRGSNLVVHDDGIEALVVRLGGSFDDISIEGELVTGGGAAPLPRVARSAVAAGLLGLEFLVGIPGTVGGAVRQNAGGHGVEVADVLVDAEVMDARTGAVERSTADGLDLRYRHSSIRPIDIVLSARFRGTPGDPEEGEATIRELTRWRRDRQPPAVHNAGSVFKNPDGDSAGRIIDSLGLKGLSVGEVAVSETHANFFVAGPGGTAADLYELVGRIRAIVSDRTGVLLEPEIQFVGFD